MTADLLISASDAPGILDGWTGPVVTTSGEHLVLLDAYGDTVQRLAWWLTPRRAAQVPVDWLQLDLSRAECRDRAARWLAGRLGLDVGSTAPTWEWWDIDRHLWHLSGESVVDLDPTVVPDIADVADHSTLLPDGSLLVDAVALAVVCRHFGRSS